MKKILLTLGTIATAVVPVTAIVACGAETHAGPHKGKIDTTGVDGKMEKSFNELLSGTTNGWGTTTFRNVAEVSDVLMNSKSTGIINSNDMTTLGMSDKLIDTAVNGGKPLYSIGLKKIDLLTDLNAWDKESVKIKSELDKTTGRTGYKVTQVTKDSDNNDGEWKVDFYQLKSLATDSKLTQFKNKFNDMFELDSDYMKNMNSPYLYSKFLLFNGTDGKWGMKSNKVTYETDGKGIDAYKYGAEDNFKSYTGFQLKDEAMFDELSKAPVIADPKATVAPTNAPKDVIAGYKTEYIKDRKTNEWKLKIVPYLSGLKFEKEHKVSSGFLGLSQKTIHASWAVESPVELDNGLLGLGATQSIDGSKAEDIQTYFMDVPEINNMSTNAIDRTDDKFKDVYDANLTPAKVIALFDTLKSPLATAARMANIDTLKPLVSDFANSVAILNKAFNDGVLSKDADGNEIETSGLYNKILDALDANTIDSKHLTDNLIGFDYAFKYDPTHLSGDVFRRMDQLANYIRTLVSVVESLPVPAKA